MNGQLNSFNPGVLLIEEILDKPVVRMIMIVVTSAVISSLMPLIFLLNLPVSFTILKWSIILSSGFIAGLVSRLLLKNNSINLQFVAALAAIIFHSYILGYLTLNTIGFHGSLDSSLSSSVGWGAELLVESLLAAITLRVRHSSKPKIRVPLKVARNNRKPKLKAEKNRTTVPGKKNGARKIRTRKPATSSTSTRKIRTDQTKRKKTGSREILVIPSITRLNQVDSARLTPMKSIESRLLNLWKKARIYKENLYRVPNKARSNKVVGVQKSDKHKPSRVETNNVRLLGQVEHRCPYCLDEVTSNDPRGVKICPICQTHHHLDCWYITGVCQVPHQS